MHLEIKHLRLVAAIADTGGITRAGERLFLTQSALSHQLKEIEQRLRSPLFLRVGRRMMLTPAGQRVLDAARSVIGELERVESDIASAGSGGPAGLLRIAVECYTCYHWLPSVLAKFQKQWPRVEVRIVPEATRRPLDALSAGELDVAIVSHSPDEIPRVAGRRFEHAPLFDDEMVVIVPPGHRIAGKEYATAADFAQEQVLLYNVREDESTLLHEILRPAGVRPAGVARVEITEAIIELVKAGLGISVLARWAVTPHVRRGALVALPLTPTGYHRRWSAIMKPRADSHSYLNDFVTRLGRDAFPVRHNHRLQADQLAEPAEDGQEPHKNEVLPPPVRGTGARQRALRGAKIA